MSSTHEIAREYSEPVEGLGAITAILTIECTCGENFIAYSMNSALGAKMLADEHASHAAWKLNTEKFWTITKTAHRSCADCITLKEPTVDLARGTEKVGATLTHESHSCTVARRPKHPHNTLNTGRSAQGPTEPAESEQGASEGFSKPETLDWGNDFTRALALVIKGHEDDDSDEVIEWLYRNESNSDLWDVINTFSDRVQSMARADKR